MRWLLYYLAAFTLSVLAAFYGSLVCLSGASMLLSLAVGEDDRW